MKLEITQTWLTIGCLMMAISGSADGNCASGTYFVGTSSTGAGDGTSGSARGTPPYRPPHLMGGIA